MKTRLKQNFNKAVSKIENIAFSPAENTVSIPFVQNWIPLLNSPFPAFKYLKSEMMMHQYQLMTSSSLNFNINCSMSRMQC